MFTEVRHYRVTKLPEKGRNGDIYYITNGNGSDLNQYIADNNGVLRFVGLVNTTPPFAISVGTNAISSGTAVFSNANGVSFGITGSTITASVLAGGLLLSNSNGISFGTNAGTVTASYTVPTDYISSNQSSLFFIGSNSTLFLQTDYTSHSHSQFLLSSQSSLFQQTSGMSQYLGTSYTSHTHSQYLNNSQSSLLQQTSLMSNYLDTNYTSHTHSQYLNNSQSSLFRQTSADTQLLSVSQSSLFEQSSHTTLFLTSQSNQAFSAGNGSATFQTLSLADSNGVSFSSGTQGLFATVRTNYQSSGNYLTTARASNDAIGLNTALTANGVSMTANSSGLSLNFPAFLTTAQPVGAYLTTAMVSNAGSNFVNSSAGLNLTNISATLNSNSISLSVAAQSIQPVAASGSNGSFAFSTLSFGNSNGLSFYTTNGSIVGSYTAAGGADGVNILAAGTQTANTTGTVLFGNSNGISFGMSNSSVITASYTVPTQSVQPVAFSASGSSSNFSTLQFGNSNGVSFSISNGSLVATVKTDYQSSNANYLTSQSNQAFSAGAASSAFQTLSFQDSNGISFSNNAGAIRLTHDLQFTSNTSAITSNAFNTSGSSNFVLTANSSLLQHTSATSNITSNALNTSVSRVINLIAATNNTGGGTASLSGNISFSNANGMTFYTSAGSAIIASYSVPTQSVQTQGMVSVNGSTGNVSFVVGSSLSSSQNGSTVTWGLASNITTALQSAGAYLTTAALSNHSHGVSFTSGSVGFQTLSFTNSNGFSFNSGTQGIFGSYTVPTQSTQPVAFSASGSSSNFSTIQFGNSNGISFSISNGSIVGTVATNYQSQGAYLTTARASNDAIGLNTALTANGVSVTANSSGLSLNFPAFLTTAMLSNAATISNIKISAGTLSSNRSDISFNNANGVSFGLETNGIITASVAAAGGAQTGISGLILSNTTYTSGTVSFRDGNGISFASTTGQGISITHDLQFTSNTSNITSNAFNTSGSSRFIQNWKLTGNSAGTQSSAAGSDLWLAGGNGITLSGSSNSISFSVATNYQSQGAYLTTAAQSTQTLAFSLGGNSGTTNSSNVTAGGYVLAGGSNITLSQSNNSISIHAQSQSVQTQVSGNIAGSGFSSAGNNIGLSGTLNSNGFSLSATVPSQSNQNISLFALGNTTQNSSTVLNASNLSFNAIGSLTVGYSNGSIQLSAPNALTTARASTDAVGLNTALTAGPLAWTVNSSGISLNAGSAAGTSSGFGGNLISGSITHNTAGINISLNHPAWLTTADLSANSSKYFQNWKITGNTAGTTSSAQGTDLWLAGGNGVTISGSSNTISLSVATNYQSQGAYLTTAMQSGSQSQLWIMGNSSAAIGGTNISGTMYSNGLSLSVAAPGGGGGIAASLSGNSTSAGAGYSNITSGTMILAGGPNITLSQNGSIISISAANPGAAAEANAINLLGANTAGNTTATGSTIGWSAINLTLSGTNDSVINISAPAVSSLSATGAVSISVNGSTISIGVPNPYISSFQNLPAINASSLLTWNGASISHAAAFNLPEQGSFSFIRIPALMTTNSTTIATLASATASASGALYSTINAVFYSIGSGASSRSLQSVTSGQGFYTMSQQISVTNSTQGSYSLGFTAEVQGQAGRTSLTTQYSISNTNYSFTTNQIATQFSSARYLDIPFAGSLSAGPYWVIIGMSSSSASAGAAGLAALTNCNVRYSGHYGVSQAVLSMGVMGSTNLTSTPLGAASFSTAGGGTTASLNISALSSMASNAMMYFQLLRSA